MVIVINLYVCHALYGILSLSTRHVLLVTRHDLTGSCGVNRHALVGNHALLGNIHHLIRRSIGCGRLLHPLSRLLELV
jgi:hypothetical protein